MPGYSGPRQTTQTATSTSSTNTNTTASGGRRIDAGGRPTGFTPPTAENDREGPVSSIINQFMNGPGPGGYGLGGYGLGGYGLGGFGMGGYGPGGYGFGGGFGMGGYDPMFADPMIPYLGPQDPWLTEEDEKWGEVEQTTLDTLEQSSHVKQYGSDAVLVVANGPEDMKQLDHEDEADRIAESRGEGQETVVLWNPSPEALTGMLREGGFQDVVFSGHGEEGVVYMTGSDGAAVAVSGDELAGMMENTNVQNVFLNVCHGMGGENSVAESLANIGLNTMGWMDSVSDGTARQGAEMWAQMTQDGGSMSDFLQTASNFAGMDTKWGDGQLPSFPGLGGLFRQDTPQNDAPRPEDAAPANYEDPLLDIDLSGLDLFNWGGSMWL